MSETDRLTAINAYRAKKARLAAEKDQPHLIEVNIPISGEDCRLYVCVQMAGRPLTQKDLTAVTRYLALAAEDLPDDYRPVADGPSQEQG